MPTDQNNGVVPNQNPINDNNATNPNDNSWDQNIDLNLDGIELDTTSLSSDEKDAWDLSADSLFDSWSSDAESSESNGGADDRLIQEDKAVQESENKESGVQPVSVPENTESVEQVTKTVESVVEWVENEWVDLSGLADVLPTQAEEQSASPEQAAVEVSSPENSIQTEPEQPESVQNNEPVVQDNGSVEEEWVDLTGLAGVLPTQAEEQVPANPEQAHVEVSAPESSMQTEPEQTESVQNNNSVVQDNGPVESNNEWVKNEWVTLNSISEPLDTGGTDLDAPSEVNEVTIEQPQKNTNDWIPADSLTIENVWVPVVEDRAGNMVSDTWDFSGKNDGYVPNESEFQKMSKLLDGSKPWQIEMPADAMVQSTQAWENTVQNDNSKWVFNLDYVVSSLQDTEKKHTMSSSTDVVNTPEIATVTPTIPNVSDNNTVNSNIPVVNVQSTDNVAPVQPVMGQVENMQNNSVQGQWYVYQPNVPMDMPQAPVQPVVTNSDTWNNTVQVSAPKTHHGPSALVIILIVICLLGAVWYILYKMYPDVVSGILWKTNISIESTNSEISLNLLWDDKDSVSTDDNTETWDLDLWDDVLTWDVLAGETEQLDNDTQDGSMDDILDPDTLTALLQLGDEDTDTENADTENIDTEDAWEVVTEIHNSPEDTDSFDTYKDLWLLIDEWNSEKDSILEKLNDYKAQGIIYQDWWSENDNQGAYKYGSYIVKKTTAMIDSIETTGKIDMNELEKIFDTFDWYLSKLDGLVSN